jgi:hypothetical protein
LAPQVWCAHRSHDPCCVEFGAHTPWPLQVPKLPQLPLPSQTRVIEPQWPHACVSLAPGVQPEQPPLTHAVLQLLHIDPLAPHAVLAVPGLHVVPVQQPLQLVEVQAHCPATHSCPLWHGLLQPPQ